MSGGGILSAGSCDRTRWMIAELSGCSGMRIPSGNPSKSSNRSSLRLALRSAASGPWQGKQWLDRMGWMSRRKSMASVPPRQPNEASKTKARSIDPKCNRFRRMGEVSMHHAPRLVLTKALITSWSDGGWSHSTAFFASRSRKKDYWLC